jgi:hypothetical protein
MMTHREPWDRVVVDAAPGDHIVQLYQDQDFLCRAVCRYAEAGLANGEGVILASTKPQWSGFGACLEAHGVDIEAARARGQLAVADADALLPRFMPGGTLDPPVFRRAFRDVLGQVRAGGIYQKVRAWGEMVNLLWERGDVAASMNLEDLFDQLNRTIDIAMFCSFQMDNFDDEVQEQMLPRLGTNHSHLIPVEDYARLERAVDDALRETVGPDEAHVLESQLLSRYQPLYSMPSAQALLLALRRFLPAVADPVLRRGRELYCAPGVV